MNNTLIREMIAKLVSEEVLRVLEQADFDARAYINSKSTAIANEVHQVLCKYGVGYGTNDFKAIEEIVAIYEKHGFSGGSIHDF